MMWVLHTIADSPSRLSLCRGRCPWQILEERGVKESIRFDPKLKGRGLLDVKMPKPDSSVPK